MIPRVSVVMPVYNCEAYVGLAIESILNQTYEALELIIVDDASTDNTPAIIAQYDGEKVRVLRHEQNLGVTRARNAGIAVAQGDYIAAMDADDISMPERIARQVEYLADHPQLRAVGCWEKIIDAESTETSQRHPPVDPVSIQQMLTQQKSLDGATLMFRSSVLRALGGYRLWVAEDYDLLLRLTDDLPGVGVVPEIGYQVRRGHMSICSSQWDMVALCMWVALESAKARRAGRQDFLEGLSPEETREFCCRVREGRGWLGRMYHAEQHWHLACQAHARGQRWVHLRELARTLSLRPNYPPAWQALSHSLRRRIGVTDLG